MNLVGIPLDYSPMHEVVPRAVSTAEMIDARICSVHFSVSFFVIRYLLPGHSVICSSTPSTMARP